MNIKHNIGITVLVCLCLCNSNESRADAPDFTPQKQSLAIPVSISGGAGRSLQCVLNFGPTAPIRAIAFGSEGKTLAAAGYKEVLIWDLANAKLLKRIGGEQLGGSPHALVFLKDGKSLAVGEGVPHQSGVVRIFDVESGKQTQSFEEPKEVVFALALSPDGKHLAAGAADNSAYVWNVDDNKLVATLTDHAGWVLGVSFSPNGKLLATAGADNSLRLWNTETWKWTSTFTQKDAVHCAVFATDVKLLTLAVGGPGASGLRMRRTDNVRYNRAIPTGGMPLDMVVDPKAYRLYVGCSDNTIKAVDSRYGSLRTTFSGHEDWVYCVALSPDATKLASGSGDGTVKLWTAADGKLVATLVQLSPRGDDWLILTAQGHLTSSSADALQWKATNLKTATQEITGLLNNAELAQKAIAGEKTAAPALE